MQEEMLKQIPNAAVLEDRMLRTMSFRRKDVSVKTLTEILDSYPALRLDREVCKQSLQT